VNGTGAFPIYSGNNNFTLILTDSTLISKTTEYSIRVGGTGASLYARNNTYGQASQLYRFDNAPTLDSDYNAFGAGGFKIAGDTYANLALYQAGTGQDANSTQS
jgi:hypothetical protein